MSVRCAFALVLALSLSACATYQTKVSTARDAMRSGNATKAVEELEPLAKKHNDDQLVYLLDYATALQQAGRFKESMQAFALAEKIADIKDYHSISNIASSLVLSEGMIQYKGDDYEKVMINALNAINYLETDNLDEALVEVRKLNQKLYKFKYEAKRDYEQNPYAYYISAVIWEADHKWDDAYIAYKSAYDLIPDFPPLHADLIRSAERAQRPEELAEWKKKFPEVHSNPDWRDRTLGEVVFIYEQGWGPRKRPRPENPRFPYLVPEYSPTQYAKLEVEAPNSAQILKSATTNRVFSIQDVAIKTLNDDYGRLVASRVAGIATKAVIADQIRQHNELLGLAAWVAMNVADQADLRQWSTLPQSLQVARMYLKAGHYKVKAQGLNGSGGESGDDMPFREIDVKPGQKTFISWRSLR